MSKDLEINLRHFTTGKDNVGRTVVTEYLPDGRRVAYGEKATYGNAWKRDIVEYSADNRTIENKILTADGLSPVSTITITDNPQGSVSTEKSPDGAMLINYLNSPVIIAEGNLARWKPNVSKTSERDMAPLYPPVRWSDAAIQAEKSAAQAEGREAAPWAIEWEKENNRVDAVDKEIKRRVKNRKAQERAEKDAKEKLVEIDQERQAATNEQVRESRNAKPFPGIHDYLVESTAVPTMLYINHGFPQGEELGTILSLQYRRAGYNNSHAFDIGVGQAAIIRNLAAGLPVDIIERVRIAPRTFHYTIPFTPPSPYLDVASLRDKIGFDAETQTDIYDSSPAYEYAMAAGLNIPEPGYGTSTYSIPASPEPLVPGGKNVPDCIMLHGLQERTDKGGTAVSESLHMTVTTLRQANDFNGKDMVYEKDVYLEHTSLQGTNRAQAVIDGQDNAMLRSYALDDPKLFQETYFGRFLVRSTIINLIDNLLPRFRDVARTELLQALQKHLTPGTLDSILLNPEAPSMIWTSEYCENLLANSEDKDILQENLAQVTAGLRQSIVQAASIYYVENTPQIELARDTIKHVAKATVGSISSLIHDGFEWIRNG